MRKLIAATVAALFAAASLQAVAQSKDVTDKKGGTVQSKDGKSVTTKDVKDKPAPKQSEPKPAPEPKKREKGADVKTKSGGAVTSKDGKDVTGKSK